MAAPGTLFGVVLVGAVGARVVGYQTWVADGPSSEPLLANDDRFVTRPLSGQLERGEVVVLRSPAEPYDIIKRVVAVGGDRVAMVANVVSVNGEPIRVGEGVEAGAGLRCHVERQGTRSWSTVEDALPFSDDMEERVVPDGHVFVLGDHRDRSNDSRRIGFVPLASVHGTYAFHYRTVEPRLSCPPPG